MAVEWEYRRFPKRITNTKESKEYNGGNFQKRNVINIKLTLLNSTTWSPIRKYSTPPWKDQNKQNVCGSRSSMLFWLFLVYLLQVKLKHK